MLKIGITGGIGSGKSTVCRLFTLYVVPVYDCDARAKSLMDTDPSLAARITGLLGSEAYAGGKLDRKYVAGRVFADKALLDELDAIVHPAVGRDFGAWANVQPGPYVIMESAILFESGFDRMVDVTVAVTAPEELRVGRTVARDGCSPESVRSRIAAQMDDRQRSALADHAIINDGRHSLIGQVDELHKIFSLSRN